MSLRFSPLETLDPLALKVITSALNLFAAASKEILVLVESSKNKFTTVLPSNVGSFLTDLPPTSAIDLAVSNIEIASLAFKLFMLYRCFNLSPLPHLRHQSLLI